MFNLMKKSLVLAAAMMIAAVAGTGCSAKKSEPVLGKAKVAVQLQDISDIASVKLTITGGASESGFPITTFLTKGTAGNVWNANVTGIPAGTGRTFLAQAFDAASTLRYEGSTAATIDPATTATVVIILQQVNPNPGPTNYAPQIDSLTATASYVLPGQTGSFAVTAHDPDDAAHYNRPAFNGSPLSYKWAAACTQSGTLTIDSPTAATTGFTAPTVPLSTCTVSVTVSETGLAVNSSVTTYFTLEVNGNFGTADIFAFPNTYPVVTIKGDFRYNPWATDITDPNGARVVKPGQEGDLFVHATDPDGDNVQFDLTASCGAGFDAANNLVAPVVVYDAGYFSFTSQKTPPVANFDFNPTYGYNSASRNTDASKSCVFTVVVRDLCTAGNCGASTADGSFKTTTVAGASVTSHTTGILNAVAPAVAKRAPTIVRVITANQLGSPTGSTSLWDPKNAVQVAPSGTYAFSVDAEDTYGLGQVELKGTCNVGTITDVAYFQASARATLATLPAPTMHYEGIFNAPGSLLATMNCTITVKSLDTNLATVATIVFQASDPCVGKADGISCTSKDLCVKNSVCVAQACTAGKWDTATGTLIAPVAGTDTVKCSAQDTCHVAGTCNTNTGACSNPIVTADGNGNPPACDSGTATCTVGDHCSLSTGACVAGPAPTQAQCFANNAPTNTFCYNATSCTRGAFPAYTCSYGPAPTTQSCALGDATVKCPSTAAAFTSFACDGAGACVGSGSSACAPVATSCTTGSTCTTGTCSASLPLPPGTQCLAAAGCNSAAVCDGTGSPCPAPTSSCGTSALSPACNTVCSTLTNACVDKVIRPQLATANSLVQQANGVALASDGTTYVGGAFGGTVSFGATSTFVAGANDGYVVAYKPDHTVKWVSRLGGADATAAWVEPSPSNQNVNGLVLTAGNNLVALGSTDGGLKSENGAISLVGVGPRGFLAVLDSTGAAKAGAIQFNIGLGSLANIASYQNKVAFCASVDLAATDIVAGATYATPVTAGNRDVLIAVYDVSPTTGALTLSWAKQLGTDSDETCNGVAFDNTGNLVAVGSYNKDGAAGGIFAPNGTALTSPDLALPNNNLRVEMWVAKFDATGAVTAQAAFGNFGANGAVSPTTIAVDSNGNVAIGGGYAQTLPFSGLPTLSLAGNTDAFVVKLSSTFVPVWSFRVGATGQTPDSTNSVAFTSCGEVVVGGSYFGPTTGAVRFPFGSGQDAFIMKLAANADATKNAVVQFSAPIGGAGTQGISQVVAAAAADQVVFVGPYDGSTTTIPGTATLPASAGGSFVSWANLTF
jgi:hypothetical protein